MRKRFFRIAEKVAQKGRSKFRMGAVVVQGNRILSVGYNNMQKSHPVMSRNSISVEQQNFIKLHAEVSALLSLDNPSINNKTAIYVYRARRDGHQGLAKPCDVCIRFIQSMGVKKVYFSLDYQGYGEMDLVPNSKLR